MKPLKSCTNSLFKQNRDLKKKKKQGFLQQYKPITKTVLMVEAPSADEDHSGNNI